eukprot:TRINITY_DN3828_c0_g1_i1.p1 TRINITY_DN3828_c0_g1~~TRINITY_DN3828_c0_g1_i1.p1  ORF type:complete len:399 (-),score=101.19 TRINITY_DN3828_c0_g1_i1:113-1309(-)
MSSSSSLLRLLHWGPLVTLGIINWVSWATLHSASRLWGPFSSAGIPQALILLVFVATGVLTTFHFLAAILLGPGYLQKGWRPSEPSHLEFLQFCSPCGGCKAPRSHHCRRCGRCVLKMDHHCPWINNCVGHRNQGHFLAFLSFSVTGSGESVAILALDLYRGLSHNRITSSYPPLSLAGLLLCLLALGLAVGVLLAVGALLALQLKALLKNQTGIEDWILEKAAYRRKIGDKDMEDFVHPYHLGRLQNFWQVVSLSCVPASDGISWPLRLGSNPYDLTREQLCQKYEKRARSRIYTIQSSYSGSICPLISSGLRVSLNLPLTDEPRIPLEPGDRVLVSRWKKHWLYGDKELSGQPGPHGRVRGWFPRRSAVERATEILLPDPEGPEDPQDGADLKKTN